MNNDIYVASALEDFIYNADEKKLTTAGIVVIGIFVLLVIKGLYGAFKVRGHRGFAFKMDKEISKKLKKSSEYTEINEAISSGKVLYISMIHKTSLIVATKVKKYAALVEVCDNHFKLFTIIGKNRYFKTRNVMELPFDAIDFKKSKVKKNTIKLVLNNDKGTYDLFENQYSDSSVYGSIVSKISEK